MPMHRRTIKMVKLGLGLFKIEKAITETTIV